MIHSEENCVLPWEKDIENHAAEHILSIFQEADELSVRAAVSKAIQSGAYDYDIILELATDIFLVQDETKAREQASNEGIFCDSGGSPALEQASNQQIVFDNGRSQALEQASNLQIVFDNGRSQALEQASNQQIGGSQTGELNQENVNQTLNCLRTSTFQAEASDSGDGSNSNSEPSPASQISANSYDDNNDDDEISQAEENSGMITMSSAMTSGVTNANINNSVISNVCTGTGDGLNEDLAHGLGNISQRNGQTCSKNNSDLDDDDDDDDWPILTSCKRDITKSPIINRTSVTTSSGVLVKKEEVSSKASDQIVFIDLTLDDDDVSESICPIQTDIKSETETSRSQSQSSSVLPINAGTDRVSYGTSQGNAGASKLHGSATATQSYSSHRNKPGCSFWSDSEDSEGDIDSAPTVSKLISAAATVGISGNSLISATTAATVGISENSHISATVGISGNSHISTAATVGISGNSHISTAATVGISRNSHISAAATVGINGNSLISATSATVGINGNSLISAAAAIAGINRNSLISAAAAIAGINRNSHVSAAAEPAGKNENHHISASATAGINEKSHHISADAPIAGISGNNHISADMETDEEPYYDTYFSNPNSPCFQTENTFTLSGTMQASPIATHGSCSISSNTFSGPADGFITSETTLGSISHTASSRTSTTAYSSIKREVDETDLSPRLLKKARMDNINVIDNKQEMNSDTGQHGTSLIYEGASDCGSLNGTYPTMARHGALSTFLDDGGDGSLNVAYPTTAQHGALPTNYFYDGGGFTSGMDPSTGQPDLSSIVSDISDIAAVFVETGLTASQRNPSLNQAQNIPADDFLAALCQEEELKCDVCHHQARVEKSVNCSYGHLVCKRCLKNEVSSVIKSQKTCVQCPAASCDDIFTFETMKSVLSDLYFNVIKNNIAEKLAAASERTIEEIGTMSCPSCSYHTEVAENADKFQCAHQNCKLVDIVCMWLLLKYQTI